MAFTETNIKRGFEKCGLVPLMGRSALKDDACGARQGHLASIGTASSTIPRCSGPEQYAETKLEQVRNERKRSHQASMTELQEKDLYIDALIEFNKAFVASMATRPEQMASTSKSSALAQSHLMDGGEEEDVDVDDEAGDDVEQSSPRVKRLKGESRCLTSPEWLTAFQEAEDSKAAAALRSLNVARNENMRQPSD